uniref:Uncharacterized protein n=1 Tax=Glossina morsitans morsitans TaxID=37546 RepID=A0ABK9NGB8_GLOMM
MNGYNRKSPSKRRYEGSKYSSTPKKKARASKERIPQPKNTVAMLNELRHGLVYKLESQTGPVHAPLFTISVERSQKRQGAVGKITVGKSFQRWAAQSRGSTLYSMRAAPRQVCCNALYVNQVVLLQDFISGQVSFYFYRTFGLDIPMHKDKAAQITSMLKCIEFWRHSGRP